MPALASSPTSESQLAVRRSRSSRCSRAVPGGRALVRTSSTSSLQRGASKPASVGAQARQAYRGRAGLPIERSLGDRWSRPAGAREARARRAAAGTWRAIAAELRASTRLQKTSNRVRKRARASGRRLAVRIQRMQQTLELEAGLEHAPARLGAALSTTLLGQDARSRRSMNSRLAVNSSIATVSSDRAERAGAPPRSCDLDRAELPDRALPMHPIVEHRNSRSRDRSPRSGRARAPTAALPSRDSASSTG